MIVLEGEIEIIPPNLELIITAHLKYACTYGIMNISRFEGNIVTKLGSFNKLTILIFGNV